jgi:hypothetical protein
VLYEAARQRRAAQSAASPVQKAAVHSAAPRSSTRKAKQKGLGS